MTIVQKGKVLVGVAKQASLGTPADNPWYAHALTGGKAIAVEIDEETDAVTSSSRTESAGIRKGINPSLGSFTTHAYMRSLGLYLLAAFGSVVDSGTTGAYTHTYASGDTLPYLTAWGLLDSEYQRVSDIKINELGLSWDGPGPIELSIVGPGCDLLPYVDPAWDLPAGSDNEIGSQSFLIPTGGTFKIAADGDSPAEALITGGEIKVSNELDSIPSSAKLTPGDQGEKKQPYTTTLKVVPDDLDMWRLILTGSATGTSVQETPQYGSFEIEFEEHGAGAGKLNLRAHKVRFLCDFPDADPGGGHVELDMVGSCYDDGTYDPIVAVLTNAVQYYGAEAPGS